ncbi:MAG TPA: pilus assembly protein TadG-related protein [Candidatus Limnocylindrales bacterium]|nr:pilus assembly protein TadG-related protein [Candidatus Limnocylindrales bacterium]
MSKHRAGGQILPLFVLAMVVILALGSLLVDGASALVTRRRLQNVGDAASLAGANALQATGSGRVCSTVSTDPPGAPRQDIVDAVMASLATNWPAITAGDVTITCPPGWENQAVRVDLRLNSATFISGAIGMSPPSVGTTSIAVNGQLTGSGYSVVLLDPGNPGWPNGRRGCPAFLISGGPTLLFDGSVYVNSACSAGDGGALATNGNSATVTLASDRAIRVVGGYDPGPLTISPTPMTGATRLDDPLAGLEPMSTAGMTVRSSARLVLNNETQVLLPGVYRGGIQLRNSSVALLRPGIYVFDGGGLDVGAQASFCSINATSTATTCATFDTDCPDTTCGVLLYNQGTASGGGAMGQLTVGAGATLKLRAYDDRANADEHFEYRNLLIWQGASPVPTSSYAQPIVQLSGGGNVDISGTVYAPSAKVLMGGNSGGTGGGSVELLLQFICWDLEMSGNSAFHYFYSDSETTKWKDYGLVQ